MDHAPSLEQQAILTWFAKKPTLAPLKVVDNGGNLVVRARAGCGKTTIVIEGVKVAPERKILICAFSKIIQLELDKRIGKNNPNVRAQTLHSVGLGCVRRFRDNLRIDFSDNRKNEITDAVCDRTVPDAIKKLVTKLHTLGREIAPHAVSIGDLTEIAIKFECEPDEQWENSGFPLERVEWLALEAMSFASNIKAGGTIDGSDMIFLPVRNHWLYPMYDLVVVDEAQDMNTAQLEISKGVLKPGGRICVVGDDRQAIFGFRGADSESIDRLKLELNAAELPLNITYRCGTSIVRLAQVLVPDFQAGPNNGAGNIYAILPSALINDASPGDFILSRVNAPLVSVAMKMLMAGKRTRIMGHDIGKGLITLVNKFKARSVPDFLTRVGTWEERELMRLQKLHDAAEEKRQKSVENRMDDIRDKAAMLVAFAEDAKSVADIVNLITKLFEDDGLGDAGLITCSSVHRAKGLEANKVYLLEDTFRDYCLEEQNIKYVAITRAKNTLVWVSSSIREDYKEMTCVSTI